MPTLKTKAKSQTEKQVVTSCHAWLKRNGWMHKTLFTGGIPTLSGTIVPNPAKGIPDSINFHVELGIIVWIEYKRTGGGKLSPEQIAWHKLLERCGAFVIIVDSLAALKKQIASIVFQTTYKLKEVG